MRYYEVHPEVGGGLGSHSKLDHSNIPATVIHLNYHFDGWLGDVLLVASPSCFIVTVGTMNRLASEALSGISFDEVEVTCTDEFKEFQPDTILPDFKWMKVIGSPKTDDFGLAKNRKLVVSERALKILQQLGIPNAHVCEPAQ